MEITLPHKFTPRPYQLPLMAAMDGGCLRAVAVWHRRSGKEKVCVNIVSKKMWERVGSYYYVFPEFKHGRKVLWDGMDKEGFPFLQHFPKKLLEGKPNDTEMKLRYKNGSLFQIIGSDTFDSVMGTNPIGIVFSEYALQNPRCWGFFRPILAENGGWAIFNFTPRGENHAYDLHSLALNDPNWFCQTLTVENTKVLPPKILEQERSEIIKLYGDDALYQQEYFCNFTVPIAGAYYAEQIMTAYKEGRVCHVPYEERVLVDTWWDLGYDDSMSIWFTQTVGTELRVIDFYENSGKGLPFYIQTLKDRGYMYGEHTAPHDINVHELTSGTTRLETASKLGVNFLICPKIGIVDGIDASRALFRKCWFDKEKCADGLSALKSYHKKYDETRKCYLDHPEHNWASHASDAFRTLAVAYDYTTSAKRPTATPYEILQKKTDMQGGWVHPRFRQREFVRSAMY